MNDWIVTDPEILGGKPCIKGTRISVQFLLELLASGSTRDQILEGYPQVQPDAYNAAIQYAAEAMRNEVVWETKAPA
jgi:uncharacterized protein (DUF433 family)